jgi:hypothetical protein
MKGSFQFLVCDEDNIEWFATLWYVWSLRSSRSDQLMELWKNLVGLVKSESGRRESYREGDLHKCTLVLHCELGGPNSTPKPRCLLFCVVAEAPRVRCVPDDCATILNMFILVGASCMPVNHSAARSRKGALRPAYIIFGLPFSLYSITYFREFVLYLKALRDHV